MLEEHKLLIIRLDISGKAENALKLALTWKDSGTLEDVSFNLKDSSTEIVVKCVEDTDVQREIVTNETLGKVISIDKGVLVVIQGSSLKDSVSEELYDDVFDRAVDEGISDENIKTVFKG